MKALMIGMLWLAVSPVIASETPAPTTAENAQPAMALIDTSVERLHVALDLSGLLGAGNGLVINMLIANDEQARADTSIAALVARLPKGLLTRSLRQGLNAAALEHGLDVRKALLVAQPRTELFAKVKDNAGIDRGLLLRFGTHIKTGNTHPIAITPDFRQLRISLDVELLERRNRNFGRLSRQTVTVFSAPASVHLGALAQDAWAANDGALLAQAIEAAVSRACALALAPPATIEPEVGDDEHVDVITAIGGERFQGRIIDRNDSEVVIARPGGDLLVVPVQRVLTPPAGA